MRFRLTIPIVLLLAGLVPARAADPWGIPHERTVLLSGTVVDLLCHLKKDCPAACAAGRRQLGLLTDDGRLRMVAKGGIDFANGVPDLVPYCGKRIEVDGLLIENPAITLLFVQRIRSEPAAEFQPADRFLRDWSARNGRADEWFRNDPEVKAIIAEDGPYGIKGLVPAKP